LFLFVQFHFNVSETRHPVSMDAGDLNSQFYYFEYVFALFCISIYPKY